MVRVLWSGGSVVCIPLSLRAGRSSVQILAGLFRHQYHSTGPGTHLHSVRWVPGLLACACHFPLIQRLRTGAAIEVQGVHWHARRLINSTMVRYIQGGQNNWTLSSIYYSVAKSHMEDTHTNSKRQNVEKIKGSSTVWCVIDVHMIVLLEAYPNPLL